MLIGTHWDRRILSEVPALSRGALVVCLASGLLVSGGCTRHPAPPPAQVTFRIGIGLGGTSLRRGLPVLIDMLFAESLISVGRDGHPTPRLAESWTWEDDGRTLRIFLRGRATFHDGRPVTSAEVLPILRRVLNEARSTDYFGGFAYVQSVEAAGDRTIVFRLSRPDAFLLTELNNTNIVPGNAPSVGTGPFRILTREPRIEFARYEQYYGGVPAIDRIQIVTYESQRSAWAAMMRGEIDMVQEVSKESVDFLQGASEIETYPSLKPFYIPLVFNLRHPILGRVETRRALTEAIDRSQIVGDAMRGHGRVADDPVWPFHWAYSTAARRYTYNPVAARLRLESAGLPVRTAPPGQMASRFHFTCLFWSEDPQFERIALLLQRQLSEVGVDMALEPAPLSSLVKRVASNDFDAYLFQVNSGRSFDWTYRYWHSPQAGIPPMQNSGYAGADAILERLRAARSDNETRIAVADLQQRFYEDAPAVFLAWQETTRAVDARFSLGDRTNPDIFANMWQWRPVEPIRRSAR
jgi:peptide/nickel transport system substrate-binding protein